MERILIMPSTSSSFALSHWFGNPASDMLLVGLFLNIIGPHPHSSAVVLLMFVGVPLTFCCCSAYIRCLFHRSSADVQLLFRCCSAFVLLMFCCCFADVMLLFSCCCADVLLLFLCCSAVAPWLCTNEDPFFVFRYVVITAVSLNSVVFSSLWCRRAHPAQYLHLIRHKIIYTPPPPTKNVFCSPVSIISQYHVQFLC